MSILLHRPTLIAAGVGVVCLAVGFWVGRLFGGAAYYEVDYFADGTLESLTPTPMEDRVRWGTTWYPAGEVLTQIEMEGSRKTGRARMWDSTGHLMSESSVAGSNGISRFTSYYTEPLRYCEGFSKDGKSHGHFRYYDRDGLVRAEIDFVDGARSGMAVEYYPSGAVRMVAEYDAGRQIGEASYFDPSGNPITAFDLEKFQDDLFYVWGPPTSRPSQRAARYDDR
ncbi:MAG: hypothetical protein AMXMBFR47_13260 [Planctomycetota bacterium]